jgi:ferric hydroxamate transport system substrate-binding protein
MAGAASLAFGDARPARAAFERVATVDWAVLETLLAIGVVPVAATELVLFREIAVEPEVPADVVDLGLRGMVNFELLLQTRPDLILSSQFYVTSEPRMRRIAPVESYRLYVPGGRPFEAAEEMTRSIGRTLEIAPRAEDFITGTREELSGLKARLGPTDGHPVIPINLGDARHFRVFGADSIFGEVLARLGLRNAWTQATSYSAMAPIGLEVLAQVPDAWIVIIPPIPEDAARILPASAFWNALPNVRQGRVRTLGSINPFGALPAARRFAGLLVEALRDAGPDQSR